MSFDIATGSDLPACRHGGARAGAGQPRKQVEDHAKKKKEHSWGTSDSSAHPPTASSQATDQSNNTVTPTQPAVFFAPCVSQGISRPLPENTESSSSGHPGVLTKDSFQQLTGQMNEVLDNDEYANIRIEEGRVINESISDETDNSMEGNAKVAEEESKSAKAAENSVNYQNILDYRNGLAKQICKL
ncbi:hypothetical protein BDP27DRAFT_1431785 [Rhodocollybia butyracea]|uniref:Uncharacterized protein n=1 Tax=Rhodocollybia butyracea TaxID=206335 RepID=A0A9P5P5B0_9AGAR|nr:hypothetical protein BDP27DRAFT_1431785 [Rhodocollybia butyracea]